jgi:hypothetical protein
MFLLIARCIDDTEVLVADKSLIGNLTRVITEVLTAVSVFVRLFRMLDVLVDRYDRVK